MTVREGERNREPLVDELHSMLNEAPSNAHQRERRLLEQLTGHPNAPVVLYGAGNLGRRTLALLRTRGRDVAAFIDNDRARWGTTLDGVPVMSVVDATAAFADGGLVIVTIWRAEGGHDFLVTRHDLRERGWPWVESFIPLFWGFGSDALPYIAIDLPTNVLRARDVVLAGAKLWSDERSLREYVGQTRWRLTGDFDALSPPEPNQYFADGVVHASSDEVFVDCGAFTGDTLLDVTRRLGSWREYHAFEPDPASFDALTFVVASLPAPLAERVHLYRAATVDRAGTAHFSAIGMGSAQLSNAGEIQVDCVAIDDVLTDVPPTFVKMDIEGSESAALTGATRAIRMGRPLLAVSAYHKQADLWELASQIHVMAPDYLLFLRPHVPEGFDTVLYAVPPERLVRDRHAA